MKKIFVFFGYFSWSLLFFLFPNSSSAHFGMIIPSDDMVMQGDRTTLSLDLLFWHPFEGHGMELAKPARFFQAK